MNSFHFQNLLVEPDIIHEYGSDLKSNHIPIIFDNGSSHCRVGWASSSEPKLDFKNALAKNRGNRKDKDWDILVANEIADIESVRWLLRTPHDFNVVVNYSNQETLFDYSFKHLGIDSEGELPHPVVVTEPIAHPVYCRKNMSELLFEAYNIPKVAYGVDCLFSQCANNHLNLPAHSLIISAGFQSTHIVPVVEGFADVKNALRINLGGYNCTAYMQRLLQLKNRQFLTEFNLTRMEELLHKLCFIPANYSTEVKLWENSQYQKTNTTKLILPDKVVSKSFDFKTSAINQTLELAKELAKAKHRLTEVNEILELAAENHDIILKAAQVNGCENMEQLKQKSEALKENITNLQSQLFEQNNTKEVRSFVELGIEKIQVSEILFQPSLVGYDQCGLKECIELVLNRYSPQIQNAMAKNVFVTGGASNIAGFKQRILTDLQELRPYKSVINVSQAVNPSLDAWKGAAQWSLTDHDSWITKHDFEENGWDFFVKHRFSNS